MVTIFQGVNIENTRTFEENDLLIDSHQWQRKLLKTWWVKA